MTNTNEEIYYELKNIIQDLERHNQDIESLSNKVNYSRNGTISFEKVQ